jgi:hypothetical protein
MSEQSNVVHLNTINMAKSAKAARVGQKDFGVALAGADAMLGVAEATGQASSTTAGAVLSAAFGGIGAAGSAMSQYNAPSFAGGMTNMSSLASYGSSDVSSILGTSSSSSSVIAGTDGYTQADLINSMNQNNLQLLELQALMQSNMQAWNTKSNILNADHRVKTTMIEKLSPR